MRDHVDGPSSGRRLDNRRWLIGIGVSVVFGLFAAVMALLTYSARTADPGAPTAGAAPAGPGPAAPAPEPKDRGKGHRK